MARRMQPGKRGLCSPQKAMKIRCRTSSQYPKYTLIYAVPTYEDIASNETDSTGILITDEAGMAYIYVADDEDWPEDW